jgi:flagellar biosynthesis/type III secretory pathway M-ring protein FliF/YscJ
MEKLTEVKEWFMNLSNKKKIGIAFAIAIIIALIVS